MLQRNLKVSITLLKTGLHPIDKSRVLRPKEKAIARSTVTSVPFGIVIASESGTVLP